MPDLRGDTSGAPSLRAHDTRVHYGTWPDQSATKDGDCFAPCPDAGIWRAAAPYKWSSRAQSPSAAFAPILQELPGAGLTTGPESSVVPTGSLVGRHRDRRRMRKRRRCGRARCAHGLPHKNGRLAPCTPRWNGLSRRRSSGRLPVEVPQEREYFVGEIPGQRAAPAAEMVVWPPGTTPLRHGDRGGVRVPKTDFTAAGDRFTRGTLDLWSGDPVNGGGGHHGPGSPLPVAVPTPAPSCFGRPDRWVVVVDRVLDPSNS